MLKSVLCQHSVKCSPTNHWACLSPGTDIDLAFSSMLNMFDARSLYLLTSFHRHDRVRVQAFILLQAYNRPI